MDKRDDWLRNPTDGVPVTADRPSDQLVTLRYHRAPIVRRTDPRLEPRERVHDPLPASPRLGGRSPWPRDVRPMTAHLSVGRATKPPIGVRRPAARRSRPGRSIRPPEATTGIEPATCHPGCPATYNERTYMNERTAGDHPIHATAAFGRCLARQHSRSPVLSPRRPTSLSLGFFHFFVVMILPQVHLRKPCYDFYFL